MIIDWSKAPEGATHWDTGMYRRVAGWMKLNDGVWYWWPSKDAACAMKWHASLNQHMIKTEGFVERPPSWNGEGKPPVGVPIEMKHKAATREWARPDFHVETLVWVGGKRFVTSEEKVGDLSDYLFRPIRTPEQIAEEARIAELNLMIGAIKDHPGGRHGVDHLTQLKIHEEACINLYDAGWRKQVAQ